MCDSDVYFGWFGGLLTLLFSAVVLVFLTALAPFLLLLTLMGSLALSYRGLLFFAARKTKLQKLE